MGNIGQARKTVSQALNLLRDTGEYEVFRSGFANDGYYDCLLGDIFPAYHNFELATLCERKLNSRADYLSAGDGNQQAEFFILLNDWNRFEEANAWNIKRCREHRWNASLALCYLLQGWYEVKMGRISQAKDALFQSDHILRPARLPRELSRLEWAWGLLAEAEGDYQEGLQRVDESLVICEDKGFRLQQADSLCLLGRLQLLQLKQKNKQGNDLLEKVGDNGRNALKIAEDRGYVWAKTEALKLLHSYHQTKAILPFSDPETENRLAQRYLREVESEQAGLNVIEEMIQDIKTEARKVFEDQVVSRGK